MAFKFVVLAALVAVANAGIIGYSAPAAVEYAPPAYQAYAAAPVGYAAPVAKAVVAKTIDADFDSNPQYSYAYDVQDGLTGDSKGQHETREGDIVHGSYNVLEADGTRRVVDYTADPVNGFNAVVRKEPAAVAVKAVAAPVVKAVHAAPAVYAAPAAYKVAAPLSYAAPVAAAPVAYAAPAHYGYAAPAHYGYAAPLAHAKIAAPLSYAAPAYFH